MSGWACIARLGGLGDNLVAASPLKALKRMGYKVEIITSELAHSVFLNNPYIDKLTVKKDGDLPSGDDWHQWFRSRANEYDIFANLSNSMETRHALHKGSTPFWWPVEYRRKMCAGSYLETAHDIVGVPHDFGPLYFSTDEERDYAYKTRENITGGQPFLGWVLGGSRVDKMYPFASHVICRVIKELSIPVVMFGTGTKQFQHAEIIMHDVERTNSSTDGLHLALSPEEGTVEGDRRHEKAGVMDWPVRRSFSFAQIADLMVTVDTGLGWAVAMEQMPKILMVSHASEENIGKHWVNTTVLHADPYRVPCWPCHRLHDTIDTCVPAPGSDGKAAACMADITVETIVREIDRLWNKGKVVPLREAAE